MNEDKIKLRRLSYALSNLDRYRNTKDRKLFRFLERQVSISKLEYQIHKFIQEEV